jgi:nitrogen fixation protein FixH
MAEQTPAVSSANAKPPRQLTGRAVLLMLVGFFGVTFAVNGVLIHKALSTFSGLDTDSSYHAGQVFEQDVAEARAQDAKRWQVDAKVTPGSDGRAKIDISAHDAAGAALSGLAATATFERPTDRRLDRTIAVPADAAGHFRATAELAPGQWDLVIELARQGERQFRSISRIVLR